MAKPITEIEVTLKLPVAVYRVLEPKATGNGITVGVLLTAFIVKSLEASLRGAPKFIVRRLVPDDRRSYVRITDADLPDLRQMVSEDATPKEIAARFGISVSSAANWRRRILEEQSIADAA